MHTSHFKGEMGSWGTHLFCYCTFCFTLHLFSQWRHEQFWTSTARCKPSDIFKLLQLKACACSRFPTACDKLQSVIVLLTDIQSPCWIFMPYLVCRGLSSSCTYIIETRQLFVHLFLLTQHDSLLLNQKKKFVAGLVLIHLRLDCVFCLLLTMCNKQTLVVLLQSENQYSFRKSKDLQKWLV